MRLSQFPLTTTKETPADAEIASHQLMLRAGLIRRLSSGLYTWLPLGVRVLQKIQAIVREEMNAAGAHEVLMPAVQPANLWQESGRWDKVGPLMLKFKDRHDRDFCIGPTHEEVITYTFGQDYKSYKQLPINLYQVQTKFRDETRPRFGVMRSREFIMKDAYSFSLDDTGPASLPAMYADMRAAYTNVFTRIGVDFRVVEADSGDIGGAKSEEFHVLADSGEDLLAVTDAGSFAANVEAAATAPSGEPRPAPKAELQQVETPGKTTIAAIAKHLNVEPKQCVKTLLVMGINDKPVALVLRGDHTLNEVKAANHPLVADPLMMINDKTARDTLGAGFGSLGPVKADIPVVADFAAAEMGSFICGANIDDMHLMHVNWGRDLPEPEQADLRNIEPGDPSPTGDGPIKLVRGIEVGHIFQLGDKYTQALGVTVLDADGRDAVPQMGCYGIGITRIVGAVIEQCHDERGIQWPDSVAPFRVIITPINAHKAHRTREAAEALHDALEAAGVEVLLDDRGLRPGVMFADAELIGIPHRITIGDRGLDRDVFEYFRRADGPKAEARDIPATPEAVLAALAASAEQPERTA